MVGTAAGSAASSMSDTLTMVITETRLLVETTAALVSAYLVYRQLLPSPIPGIPYNADAADRLMGDLPRMLAKKKQGKPARTFYPELFSIHHAPLVQYFMGPLTLNRPAVAIGDFRAAKELLVRHGKDLPKAPNLVAVWQGTVPEHFLGMEEGDPRMKKSKDLSRDLMTPRVLHEVNAPVSYDKVLHFIELWQRKSRLAGSECAFDAADDLNNLTYDIIMAAATNIGDKDTQIKRTMASLDHSPPSMSSDDLPNLAKFSPVEQSDLLLALNAIADAAGASITFPLPGVYLFFHNRTAKMRKAYRDRDAIVSSYISDAVKRMQSAGGAETFSPLSAVDFVVRRETASAAKEGRSPAYHTDLVIQLIFGYLLGGQDSTHATMSFLVKRLGSHQEKQAKLREHLRAAFPRETEKREQLPLGGLLAANIPYLDALIQEVLRMNTPSFGTTRRAARDIAVLGHVIPKGTRVFFSVSGSTFTEPGYHPMTTDDKKGGHQNAEEGEEGFADWADSEFPINEFHPERWLKEAVDGDGSATATMVFDPTAGPFLSFGAGNRACWGRKLAYLELKLMASLLVWNFHFEELPPGLEDWELGDSLFIKPKTCRVKLRSVWGS